MLVLKCVRGQRRGELRILLESEVPQKVLVRFLMLLESVPAGFLVYWVRETTVFLFKRKT